jgi:hypothetical protein
MLSVFLALVVFVGISLLPVLLLRRKSYPRAQDYFVSSDHTPPGVIRNSSIAYALKTAAFGPLLLWGATGDLWPAIISAAFLGLGLALIYVLRRPLLAFFAIALDGDTSISINEFVARQHGDDARVRLLAAGLTVFAFAGLIACEIIGVATIAKPMIGSSFGVFMLICAVVAAMALCVVPAGNSGAMYAGQMQLGGLYFGLFGSMVFLVYVQMSSLATMRPHTTLGLVFIVAFCALLPIFRRARFVDNNVINAPHMSAGETPHATTLARRLRLFQSILSVSTAVLAGFVIAFVGIELSSLDAPALVRDSVTALQAGTRVPIVGLIALALLALCGQVVDLTNWQRIAAFAKDRDPAAEPSPWSKALRKFFLAYAIETPFAWLFMSAFGAVIAASIEVTDGADVVQSFAAQLMAQENSFADTCLVMLFIGILALALSTMIALFSATLCTLRYDLLPGLQPRSRERGAAEEAKATRHALVAGAALCLAILVAAYLLEERLGITLTSSGFLALVIAFGCVELAFVPLVLGPFVPQRREGAGAGSVPPGWALAILGAGAAVGVGAVLVYFATGQELWLWAAVPACLVTGVVVFALARLRPARIAA